MSENGGNNWRLVLGRDQHVYDVTINPRDPNLLYAAGFESSAWQSTDRGERWTRIPGFNFKWAHRVTPDPADKAAVFVTTFGGSVWHGNVSGRAGGIAVPLPLTAATPELEYFVDDTSTSTLMFDSRMAPALAPLAAARGIWALSYDQLRARQPAELPDISSKRRAMILSHRTERGVRQVAPDDIRLGRATGKHSATLERNQRPQSTSPWARW